MKKCKSASVSGFTSCAIHTADEHNETHSHVLPIYQTSTYCFDTIEHGQALWRGEVEGHIYGRMGNPNTEATADTIAALEGINLRVRPFGLLAGSGMAAISLVMLALTYAGDTIVSQRTLYGATFTLLRNQLARHHVHHAVFDGHDNADLDRVLAESKNVRLVYIETPANPTMALTDIRYVVEKAHSIGALVVIDNTFATPYLQRPLELGADIVVHSTTKYLAGHGAVVGGAIVTTGQDLFENYLKPALLTYGAIAGPMDAWLTGLGLKTLSLRMARHCENALKIARFLEAHPAVERVYYPGLDSFEQHDLARIQMDDFGGMLSFELKGGYEAGVALMNNVHMMSLAVSLGSVDTVIQHPASMTHFKNPPEVRAQMGVTDGLVRLSVGIEDLEDIEADLYHALSVIPQRMEAIPNR